MLRRKLLTLVLAPVLLTALLWAPGRAMPAALAPMVGGCPMLPSINVWNTPVTNLPPDANSGAYVNTIGATRSLKADFGSGLWNGGPIGIPFVVVPGSTPGVNVSFDYASESDPGPYPIPANPPIEGGTNSSGDRHILIVNQGNCKLYELYAAYPNTDGTWHAGSGASYDLNSNALRPATWTSADAAGLPILPGLVRRDEVVAGAINHAIRFTAPQTRKTFIWPARHQAGSSTSTALPPMGQRFRLHANYDSSGFSRDSQIILTALKTYGMILADNGSSWYMSGAPDETWNNTVLAELGRVKGSDFDAIDESSLMVDPNSGATNTAPPPPPVDQGALKLINPVRVLDTRGSDVGGPIGLNGDGTAVTTAKLAVGQTRRFRLGGATIGGVAFPADTTGILANVTIVQGAASGGYVTLFPGDAPYPPNASTVNPATAVAANFWATAIPTSGTNAGTFALYSTNALDVVVDVVGYFSPTNPATLGNLRFISPTRAVDTRAGSGGPVGFNPDGSAIAAAPLSPRVARQFLIGGKSFGGVQLPSDVTGVLAHVTTVQGGPSGGFVTLYPGDQAAPPNASTVNPSSAVAFNSWASAVPANGTVAVYSTQALDVAIDILGYWAPSNPPTLGTLSLMTPMRVVDTRGSSGGPVGFTPAGSPIAAGPIPAGTTRRYLLSGKGFTGGSLPAEIKGVLANVTLVQGAPGGGFVTAFPGDLASAPGVSTVNPSTAIAASIWGNGLPAVGVTNGGTLGIYSVSDPRDVVVDVVGYFR